MFDISDFDNNFRGVIKPVTEWRSYCDKQLEKPLFCELQEFQKYSLPSLSSVMQQVDFLPQYSVSGASGTSFPVNNSLLPFDRE